MGRKEKLFPAHYKGNKELFPAHYKGTDVIIIVNFIHIPCMHITCEAATGSISLLCLQHVQETSFIHIEKSLHMLLGTSLLKSFSDVANFVCSPVLWNSLPFNIVLARIHKSKIVLQQLINCKQLLKIYQHFTHFVCYVCVRTYHRQDYLCTDRILHCIILHMHNIILHCIIHCTTLHCMTLHCIILHYITLCYITLHYITLH